MLLIKKAKKAIAKTYVLNDYISNKEMYGMNNQVHEYGRHILQKDVGSTLFPGQSAGTDFMVCNGANCLAYNEDPD
eukprot:13893378-Heterocapsa_arctica.AAC.1